MSCIYCIGEPLPIREKGIEAVLSEMSNQLTPIKGMLDPSKVVIAYEPVWVSDAMGPGIETGVSS
jgi:triosephosphate isomerase